MVESGSAGPIAILAGGGSLPPLLAEAAARSGRKPLVIAIAGEADPEAFPGSSVHVLRWGEIGRLFRLLPDASCREGVLIGRIAHRPDFRALRPDMAGVKLIPRILKIMQDGDNNLLTGVARIFEEMGVRVVSPLDVAPDLALPEGCVVGSVPPEAKVDIETARGAAREIGGKDIAQGAVAVGGQVVAIEDRSGTDALLERVDALRERGQISGTGGVLVKCVKPHQDRRLDLPTIGPATAEAAARAGLAGVAAEAGLTLLAGPAETKAAFKRARLFLLGLPAFTSSHG